MWRFVPALGVLLVSWSLQQDDGGSLTYWSAFTPLWILFASFSVALALGYIARVYRNAGSSTLWGAQWGVLDKTWSVPPAMLLCCVGLVLCCVVLCWTVWRGVRTHAFVLVGHNAYGHHSERVRQGCLMVPLVLSDALFVVVHGRHCVKTVIEHIVGDSLLARAHALLLYLAVIATPILLCVKLEGMSPRLRRDERTRFPFSANFVSMFLGPEGVSASWSVILIPVWATIVLFTTLPCAKWAVVDDSDGKRLFLFSLVRRGGGRLRACMSAPCLCSYCHP